MTMHRYKWIRIDGKLYVNVGIADDGRLHNPNNYPEEEIRHELQRIRAEKHQRRSRAAKEAAATRAERRRLRVNAIVNRIVASAEIGPRLDCAVCLKKLSDPLSIERGIGSDCWQDILVEVQARKQQEEVTAKIDPA
jgi:hypothetical protein